MRVPSVPISSSCLAWLNTSNSEWQCVDLNVKIRNETAYGGVTLWFVEGQTTHFSSFAIIQTTTTTLQTVPQLSSSRGFVDIIAGVVVAVVVVILIAVVVSVVAAKRHQTKQSKQMKDEKLVMMSLYNDKEELYYKENQIEMGEKIGSGKFGAVYEGKLEENHIALKKLLAVQADDFKREASVLKKLRHPNIVW